MSQGYCDDCGVSTWDEGMGDDRTELCMRCARGRGWEPILPRRELEPLDDESEAHRADPERTEEESK